MAERPDLSELVNQVKSFNQSYLSLKSGDATKLQETVDRILTLTEELKAVGGQFAGVTNAVEKFFTQVKDLPQQVQDANKQSDRTDEVVSAIKGIELKPEVKVGAPIVRVPEFSTAQLERTLNASLKEISTALDRDQSVEVDLKPLIKELKDIKTLLSRPQAVGLGGGGGAAGSGSADSTAAKQDEQTALLTTIESNQLPDGHNVTVDNASIAVTNAGLTELAAAINSNLVDVNIVSGAGSGGTAAIDDADFVDDTTLGTPAMGAYESTPTTVTDGDMGVVGITSDRKLKVQADLGSVDNAVLDNIETAVEAVQAAVEGTLTVTGGGGGTEYTSDEASPTDPIGATSLIVRDDALSTQETTDGDWTAMRGNSRGALWVQHDGNITADLGATDNAVLDNIDADLTTIIGHVDGLETLIGTTNTTLGTIDTDTGNIATSVALIDDTVFAEDVAAQAADKGLAILAVRRDADTSLVGTDNDYANLQVNANGALKVEAFSGETLPVSLTSTTVTGTVAVTQSGTWDEVGINDSGNSITVDATNLDIRDIDAATDDITIHGDVGVIDQLDLTNSNPAAVAIVDGDGTQITSFGGGVQYTEGDTDTTITGTAVLIEAGSNALATVKDDAGFGEDLTAGIMSVHGRLWDGTAYDRAPGNSTDGMLVNLGANNDISGTVTANLGATDNAVLDDIAAKLGTIDADTSALFGTVSGAELQVDIVSAPTLTVNAHAVTNAGTFVVQENGAALTALQLIDDAVYVDDADWTNDTSKHLLVGGIYQATPHTVTDGDVAPVSLDANGNMKVNIVAGSSSGVQYDEGDDITTTPTGTLFMFRDGGAAAEPVSPSSPLPISIDGDNLGVALESGGNLDAIAASVGAVDTSTSGILTATQLLDNAVFVDDADFTDGTSSGYGIMGVAENTPTTVTDGDMGMVGIDPATRAIKIHDGGNSITVDGSLTVDLGANNDVTVTSGAITANLGATDNAVLDAIQAAVEIIDNSISGSETQVDVVAALPAGTNAIGKLLPPDVDVTTHTNYAKKYYTNSGAVTDGIVWSPAAGKRWHVVSMYVQTSAAATVTFEDDKAGGDEAVMKSEFAANSGTVINFSEKYPLASGEDAADLLVTTSAGNIYITVTGYEI